LKTLVSGTPKCGAFGAQVSIDLNLDAIDGALLRLYRLPANFRRLRRFDSDGVDLPRFQDETRFDGNMCDGCVSGTSPHHEYERD